ncbi:MAG TPA: hypothetical protein VG096_04870 [Bryobacteraceae bacterium]|nr:hypothetical protein [Bryobacteraceae bacterium]
MDDRRLRASWQVLWEKDLPRGSEGVPAVYEIAGREYIVLCVAAADGRLKIESGKPPVPSGPGSYMVFALPRK